MNIDWVAKLQNLLQTVGFSLGIAAVIYGFAPTAPYGPNAVFSVSIGVCIWAIIDLGRHFVPTSAEAGWPDGWRGPALVAAGITGGFLGGAFITDFIGTQLNWFTGPRLTDARELRISLLVTLVAGVAATYFFYSRSRGAYLERQMAEARRHAGEARLKLLETQLEPHMLFNTLANLRVLIGVDPVRAQVMLDHMIAYLRATLGASRANAHPLQAEFDRLRDYLELMAIRMGPRLAYTLDLPPQLQSRSVPTLLLQPIVENSIQHGLEPKVGGGTIRVSAREEAGHLVLEVQDTGVGSAAAPGDGKGFGLAQVRERLHTVYGDAARFHFEATPGAGARTTITLPLLA